MSHKIIRKMRPAIAGFFMCAALLLGACATPQVSRLSQQWPDGLPGRMTLSQTPFIGQEAFECGPAALAMLLQTAKVRVTADDLVNQVYLPGRQGSLQLELLAASRRHGLTATVLAPEMTAVLREVAAGHPVLVFQNLSLPVYPVWHYAVVVGYDRDRNVLILHSGTTAHMEVSLFTFERTWARGGYWAMVALPASELPVTANAMQMSQSIAALERVNPTVAGTAYASALNKWPDHAALWLGAGNAAYASGHLESAASAYRKATEIQPDFADAWNNLAEVALELKLPHEARAAIARAVDLGGTRLPVYLELQQKIGKAPATRGN